MKNKLVENLIDSFKSVYPISILIIIISFIIKIPLSSIASFMISSVLLVIGISLFTTGAEISIVKIGESIGNFLVKKGKQKIILIASLIMGIVITISEPDLMVLASEIPMIPSYLMIFLVSLGIGIFLSVGVYRIIKRKSYQKIIYFSLMFIMLLLYFTKEEFVSISFDAAGVTTGPMGVPVIVAFGYGIARLRSDKDSKSDTFGLCGLASFGPIIVLLILGLFFKVDNYFNATSFISGLSIVNKFITNFLVSFKEIIISLIPIVGIYIISIILGNKIDKKTSFRSMFGLLLTILGLTIFLTGVSSGFIEIGFRIGSSIASSEYKNALIPLGMVLGFVIINAEPAIKILTKQISDLTEGSISHNLISMCLSIGVAFAIGLSVFRILFNVPIIYIIVPGYFVAAYLMQFTPKMFITIAFDSGGAACGALTTSFLLPLCIGICKSLNRNVMSLAFGVGSLVCLIPIIIIEILGIIYNHKLRSKSNNTSFDESIIDYAWEG